MANEENKHEQNQLPNIAAPGESFGETISIGLAINNSEDNPFLYVDGFVLYVYLDGRLVRIPDNDALINDALCIDDTCYELPSDDPNFDPELHADDPDWVAYGRRWIRREGTDPRLLRYIDTHAVFFAERDVQEVNDFEDRMNQAVQMFGPGLVTNEIGKLITIFDSLGLIAGEDE